MAAALMASMFILTSCEKENVAEVVAANETKAANYVLVQHGYVDEYGNIGDLYVDENNPEHTYCEIYEQKPQTRAHQNPAWTGTLTEHRDTLGCLNFYSCEDAPKNCWGSTFNPHWNKGTKPTVIVDKK